MTPDLKTRNWLIYELGGVPLKFCELWGERMYRKGLKEGMQPLDEHEYPGVEKSETDELSLDKYW